MESIYTGDTDPQEIKSYFPPLILFEIMPLFSLKKKIRIHPGDIRTIRFRYHWHLNVMMTVARVSCSLSNI